MIRKVCTIIIVLLCAGCVRPRLTGQPTPSACAPADVSAEEIVLAMQELATGTDSADVAERQSLQIPAASASEVVQVRDESVCETAAAAYYSDADASLPRYAVYVVRVRDVYVVTDNRRRVGEWVSHQVFDATFTVNLSNFAG